ncbi:acyloxyacyl hydrolase [Chryseolinea lacunae]|uniref:Acyloxyacyl hydrolase n=1 Tax=Chryseolinea lacunae TaxID=2801331 RepID=A0ABS1L2H6_9BACT|nr:acyloxyacyl hydrolase [Chryseolinea lacunae]MBL0745886.1 acyloxyacyl hydrolase [Chryseolinea lacunae]
MLRYGSIIFLILMSGFVHGQSAKPSIGQLPPFTKWYQNPLGVSPISLHTGNGLWIPAIAAAAILLFTHQDSTQRARFAYFNESGISRGYYANKTSVFQNNTGVLFFARRWMALGGEVSAYHVRDNVNDTWGFGLRPFVRFYLVHQEKWRLYFESGAGLIVFLDEFPQPSGFFGDERMGTHFNGSPKYGVGAEITLERSLALIVGVRHVHVSNGDHPSDDRNPGHDSNGFSIGFLYTPKR